MKILIANYRYFVSSGPERYMFNLMNMLTAMGHTPMPFSIHYSGNVATPYAKYFVEPLGCRDEVYFDQHRRSPRALLPTLSRLWYSREVESAIARMAEETRPDVAYVLCYLRKLSPSLLVGLKKKNIPIAARLPDYAMLCPELHCLKDLVPCTLCVKGSLFHSVRHRCVKRSYTISILNALTTWYHRSRGFFDFIDIFVTTNPFMREMMLRAGYGEERLCCIPTFTDLEAFRPPGPPSRSRYIVYVGRIDRPKGLHVLIKAFALLQELGAADVILKVVGSGHDAHYVGEVKDLVREDGLEDVVEFLGDVEAGAIPGLLGNALFSVVPSVWYENLPNSLLESLASGTPVIASNIGSLGSAVTDGVDALLFRPGDPADLAAKMLRLLEDEALRETLSRNGSETAIRQYSPQAHMAKLVALFEALASKSRPVPGRN